MSRSRVWIVCLVGLVMGGGLARGGGLTSPGCLDGGQDAIVAAVGDDLGLRLADGRELRLAGLDPVRATALRPSASDAARDALRAWLVGRVVRVSVIGAEADRWGRTAAQAFAPGPADGSAEGPRVSVAEAMLDAGFARARPERAIASCWSRFLSIEGAARDAAAGLWSDPAYRVLPGDDAAAIRDRVGGMAVVEGRITGLREGGFRSYLPMGGQGRDGFAVTIEKRTMAQLVKSGHDPKGWVGQRVRVRGFLDDRFGLQIELSSVDQVEFPSP